MTPSPAFINTSFGGGMGRTTCTNTKVLPEVPSISTGHRTVLESVVVRQEVGVNFTRIALIDCHLQ